MCGLVLGVCALVCGRLHRAFRSCNQLTELPESFGQLKALQTLYLSRASACAGCGVGVADSGRWNWVSGEQVRSEKGAESLGCVAWSWVVRMALNGRIVPSGNTTSSRRCRRASGS